MSEHTPGPWKTAARIRGGCWTDIIASRRHVAEVSSISNLTNHAEYVEQEANARLIAASPDLLKACKDLLTAISIDKRTREGDYGHDRERVRVAIAKAEGREVKHEKI